MRRYVTQSSMDEKPEEKPEADDGNEGCGCITAILFIFAVWALCFGVTIGGKHYGVAGCDSTHGVILDR